MAEEQQQQEKHQSLRMKVMIKQEQQLTVYKQRVKFTEKLLNKLTAASNLGQTCIILPSK